jgi:hypothetical protein
MISRYFEVDVQSRITPFKKVYNVIAKSYKEAEEKVLKKIKKLDKIKCTIIITKKETI